MMTNLFSMFDPCNYYFSLSWMILFILMLFPILKNLSKYNSILSKIFLPLSTEFSILTSSTISNNLLMPLFLVILMTNLISMIPLSFASTAQMTFILPMAFSLWLSNILFFSIKKTNNMLSHMVPMGSPSILMPIMVLIEIISNLIRPITLSVRLMANITAGHLLMHLLSTFICNFYPSPTFMILSLTSIILNLLEIGVAFIQSYIMCTLLALYSNEIH